MHWLWQHFLQETGTDSSASRAYNFFSGFGSDIGEVAILGGIIQIYRHANCHVKGCARLGRHEYEMDGAKYKLCRKHHPAVDETRRLTGQDFAAHHANGGHVEVLEVVKERRGPARDARGRFTKGGDDD